jgi:hypothetical protein
MSWSKKGTGLRFLLRYVLGNGNGSLSCLLCLLRTTASIMSTGEWQFVVPALSVLNKMDLVSECDDETDEEDEHEDEREDEQSGGDGDGNIMVE